MDVIIKEGPIFMQSVKFGKKIWRMTWLIVFEPSPIGIGRMELYDMRDGRGLLDSITSRPAGLNKMDKRVIRLSDCLSITPAPGESCPTDSSAFFLNTITCTHTIAAPTREDWMSVLCQLAFQASGGEDTKKLQTDKFSHLADNELYSTWGVGQFQVNAQSTDASKRCKISGPYLFSVEKDSIALLDLKTGKNIHHWPYRLLRKFGQVKGGIMFEAGRRCHTGEGHFIFLSNQGSQIHRAIEEAIMHQSVQDMLAEATSQPQEFASQPLSSDSLTQRRSKVKNPPPIKMTQDQPRLPVQRKHGQQKQNAIEEVLVHHSAPDLLPPSTHLKKEEPPTPKPRTQDRPKDRPKVNNPPPVSLTHRQPKKNREAARSSPSPPVPTPTTRVIVPRKNITLPDLPSISIRPSIPDDVLYASLTLEPKPRSRMNLPRVPTPPSLVHINDYTDVSMDQEKNSLQEPSENEEEDNPYINWTASTTAEQDQSTAEVVYSTINIAAKRVNNKSEEAGDQEQPNIDQQVPTDIPADFKQTLSNILFKDLSKISPSLPRCQGGSSDHLERTDRRTDD
ncbi:Docking protein 3 [Triplophysa tibetana]|uniref:Docking protein 3 n=1 Tax=Triplophysa tibetana TaxID=1572043 RepID=A0A5A9NKV9_9TELE|nr:Docking protein 3 [Triplophysa tibetana]